MEGAEKLKGIVSVAAMGEQKGEAPLQDNESLDVERIIALRAAVSSSPTSTFAPESSRPPSQISRRS